MGKEKGSGGDRVDIARPGFFSLVYATPLLQHQAQLGPNPALPIQLAQGWFPGLAISNAKM